MNVVLAMRRQETPQHTTAAWLIPGVDPAAWLQEMTGWRVTLVAARLYVVGAAQTPDEVAGLLVVLPTELVPSVQASPRCQPYGMFGQQLYLPVNARFDPPVREHEMAHLLPSSTSIYVWHPALGLIAFESADALRVSDLLAQPLLCATRWDRAQPGEALNERLVSIEPFEPFNLATFLQNAQGDIGGSAQRLDELPKHPKELGPLGKAGGMILGGMAQGMAWALKKMDGQAAGTEGALGGLRAWAERQSQQWSEALQLQRNRQLLRLLEMLDKNPDEGLRYALPVSGDTAPRGVARPGWQLLQRNIDFRLGSLGGGQPVDSWDAGAYHTQLLERYRALANRELGLGRYRRAAYIFAELLGDLHGAAQALQAGSHYREAAALYKDRLQLPHEAARCLMAGQHWSEAVAIYEEQHEFEKIGELYEKLADPERAAHAYRQAAARFEGLGDVLSAARLLEHKLHDVDAADARLWREWPGSTQAAKCLEASFQLLARHGRHTEARRRMRILAEGPCPANCVLPLIQRLAALATEYPDRELNRLAADRTRVMISRSLPDTPAHQCGELITVLSRLAPHDRILARDGQRFLRGHLAIASRTAASKSRKREIRLVRRYTLPMNMNGAAVAQGTSHYLVAGWDEKGLCVVQGSWRGQTHMLSNRWRASHRYSDEILLCSSGYLPYGNLVHALLAEPLEGERSFSSHDDFTGISDRLCPLNAISRNAIHARYLEDGRLVTLEWSYEGNMLLRYYSHGGANLLGVRDIGRLEENGDIAPTDRKLYCATSGNSLYIGLGTTFTIVTDANIRTEGLGRRICGLYGSRTPLPMQVGISFASGVLLLGDHENDSTSDWIARDLCEPCIGFLSTGKVVTVAEQGMEVYNNVSKKLVFDRGGVAPNMTPLAVLPTDVSDQFAVFFTSGEVRIYSC